MPTSRRAPAKSRRSGRDPDPNADEARRLLRAEMLRRGYSFKRLAEALSATGPESADSVQSLINKVNRGRFSFAFFMRASRAMGMTTLDLRSTEPEIPASKRP